MAHAWREKEAVYLFYLTDMPWRLLPAAQLSFQCAESDVELLPFVDITDAHSVVLMLTKIVEEANRFFVRNVDQL